MELYTAGTGNGQRAAIADLARHRSVFRLNAWADLAEACQDAWHFRLSRQR